MRLTGDGCCNRQANFAAVAPSPISTADHHQRLELLLVSQHHRWIQPCRAAENHINHQLETSTPDRASPNAPESPAAVSAPAGGPCAGDMPHPIFTRHRDVLFYIPNLIGYARIGLTLAALACARQYPLLCVTTYFLAFVCDELDGRAARTFNQTSTMGAVLDMVTDRVATTGLLALLCTTYPDFHIVFIALIALDIFSHWFQMYQTLLAGSSTHKDVNSRSRLVRLYYSNRIFMGFCCICCEVLYLALFLLHLPTYQQLWVIDVQIPAQLLQAVKGGPLHPLVDNWQGLPFVGLVALLALPGVVVKQACNWVQLKAAVQGLVDHDVKRMA